MFMSLLVVVLIIVSVLLCLLILFQESKGGGLAGALGGYGMKSAFGAKTAQKLTIFTAYVAAIFFALVLFLGIMKKEGGGIVERGIEAAPPAAGAKEEPGEAGPVGEDVKQEPEGEAEEPPPAAESGPRGE